MSVTVKDHNPVVKNVAGIAQALKIDASSLEELKGVENLYLSMDLDGQEKLVKLDYDEEVNEFHALQIPLVFSEEDIVNAQIVQVQIQD
ncbi:hypothetical protein IMZ31_17290 [Pontibacillus sp. ALD_SL1]|uniref:hypothetical protein n=1 Tax=Pontibacillus sp. ALD_SL1 TaxID=2777185 RepID=UPI001A95FB16|nr:hypothetical protein [Pontibacillus sp. ALD_SL1]QSS99794.1 hypothetical protein IMZ31_17290 [Pontibacillus sp. ALD_SL1]